MAVFTTKSYMTPSPRSQPVAPALFLDRDGVINHEVGYLSSPGDIRYVDGIVPLIATARALGFRIIVITNQSGIGRGYYTEDDFHRLMDHMRSYLHTQQAAFDAVYFCADHPLHGVGRYQRESPLRKPSPGMLLQATTDHSLDLASSVLVGDRCSDIVAGAAAGVPYLFLLSGTESTPCPAIPRYTLVDRLEEVTNRLTELFLPPAGVSLDRRIRRKTHRTTDVGSPNPVPVKK